AGLAYLLLPFLALVGNETLRLPLADLGVLLLALLLALSYEMTGNLLVSMVIHGLFNTTTLLVQFVMQEP
ncbi:MAG: CPBP family intramembrane metalloprotease, partial [Verrucomicrobiae bacterium]|nr:CPBP family intramembrane metalloprotease [Verrucomicrobiae bacterium]